MKVRLRSLDLDGIADDDGDTFVLSDVEGYESPDVRLVAGDLARGGVSVDDLVYGGRPITLSGKAWCAKSDDTGTWRVRHKLGLAASIGLIPEWVYFDEPEDGAPCQLLCNGGGKLRLRRLSAWTVEYEIPLLAADPRKYSQVETEQDISGSGTLVNEGSMSTPVVAELLATATNPNINNTRESRGLFQLAGTIGAGTIIDFGTQMMFDENGARIDVAQLPRYWWQLYPGDNDITTVGNWRFNFRSAWF